MCSLDTERGSDEDGEEDPCEPEVDIATYSRARANQDADHHGQDAKGLDQGGGPEELSGCPDGLPGSNRERVIKPVVFDPHISGYLGSGQYDPTLERGEMLQHGRDQKQHGGREQPRDRGTMELHDLLEPSGIADG